jgi:hypothetical protein
MNWRNTLITLLALFLLNACTAGLNHFRLVKQSLKLNLPYEIKQAMYDGCITAIWSRSNHLYKNFASYRQNPKLMQNEVYKYIWSKYYTACFMEANTINFQNIGSEIVNNRLAGLLDIRDAKSWHGLVVGGDSANAVHLAFSYDGNDAMVSNHGPSNLNNFFGFFGTCQFC